MIKRVAKAGVGMPNQNTRRPSRGFAIVTSSDASEFIFGADDTFSFWYKVFVENGVVSAHACRDFKTDYLWVVRYDVFSNPARS